MDILFEVVGKDIRSIPLKRRGDSCSFKRFNIANITNGDRFIIKLI